MGVDQLGALLGMLAICGVFLGLNLDVFQSEDPVPPPRPVPSMLLVSPQGTPPPILSGSAVEETEHEKPL